MSPTISNAACRASAALQCGAGCVSGTPGVSTSAAICDQSSSLRSQVGIPLLAAAATLTGSSSKAANGVPPASSASQVDSPASASTTETIQKRITICGSVQPSCSK